MFSSLSISLNGKPVTLHETNYHYKAYLEKLLNYGSDASDTHLVSSFWYLDSSGELKDNSRYVRQLNYLSSGNNILAPSDDNKVRIKILDATLFITQFELKTPLLLAHANILAMKRKAHYPVTHTQIKIFTASSGAQQVSIENAFLGPIPERILIAFVKNTAFVGFFSTNPFHFHHYNMTNLALFVFGIQNTSNR